MTSKDLEIVTVSEHTCGTESCHHTAIQHNDHFGWLVDGHLRCRKDDGPFFECSLAWDESLRCEFVPALDGHIHGPRCGHEMIPHGNHLDYLVGSRLHHVVGVPQMCCENRCLGEVVKSTVVDHGQVYIKQRGGCSKSEDENREPLLDKTTETDIYAAGICCPSEVPVIHKILESLPGVTSVQVTVLTKNVHVEHNAAKTSPAVLISALNGAGLQASIGKRENETGIGLKSLPLHVVFSGIFLILSIISFAHSSIEFLKYAALLAVVVGCPLIVIRAVASIRRFILDINVLMLVASAGAIALKEYHEAAAIVFLFGISQWMEDRCMGRARNAISGLRELQPEFATSATTSEPVPVGKIQIGDFLVVRPGDRVPVDGIVVSGASALDESLLTGETKAVSKKEGDSVFSGSINTGNGSLKMKATSQVTDSTVAQLAKKVEEAAMQRSKTERLVETFAKFYTPLVVVSAAIVALLPFIVSSMDFDEWVKTALVLLVTACPCALVISTPVTTICGISRAAQKSILIKGGSALETLSRLKAITFDKTGTLTEGHFEVISVQAFAEMPEEDILNWAAAIEVHSSHPLAAAIVGSAAAGGHHKGSPAYSVDNLPGAGLIGVRDGIYLGVGNSNLMRYLDCPLQIKSIDLESLEKEVGDKGQKACFVAINKRIVGAVIVADRIRSTAKQALDTLRSMKLQLGLLTGDHPIAAAHVASAVGIDSSLVLASLTPEQKASLLEDFRRRFGCIAHVGDGINDSLALASADVGIAMGVGGSTMAVEAADVALFSNEIRSIATAIKLSQKVRSVIIQNVAFSIAVKVVVITLAFVSHVQLWMAVAADIGSSLLVITNGLRLLGYERSKEEKHKHGHACKSGHQYGGHGCKSGREHGHGCRSGHEHGVEMAEKKNSHCASKCCSTTHSHSVSESSKKIEEKKEEHSGQPSAKPCCGKKHCHAKKETV